MNSYNFIVKAPTVIQPVPHGQAEVCTPDTPPVVEYANHFRTIEELEEYLESLKYVPIQRPSENFIFTESADNFVDYSDFCLHCLRFYPSRLTPLDRGRHSAKICPYRPVQCGTCGAGMMAKDYLYLHMWVCNPDIDQEDRRAGVWMWSNSVKRDRVLRREAEERAMYAESVARRAAEDVEDIRKTNHNMRGYTQTPGSNMMGRDEYEDPSAYSGYNERPDRPPREISGAPEVYYSHESRQHYQQRMPQEQQEGQNPADVESWRRHAAELQKREQKLRHDQERLEMERRELHRGMEEALRRAEELATAKEREVEDALRREQGARSGSHSKEERGEVDPHQRSEAAHSKAEVYRERSARREAELAAAEMGAKTRLDEMMRVEAEDYANYTRQELAASRGDWGGSGPPMPSMPGMDPAMMAFRPPSPDDNGYGPPPPGQGPPPSRQVGYNGAPPPY